jgi:2-polyprenyl-6-methoxyphenol hydroxylase-like FAD-dependent oxidoreductase
MMRVVIVGAGPTGLYLAIGLARRGYLVTVVDRDPGPASDGSWRRKGVMQFHHPHGFRQQVVEALRDEMPEVVVGLVAAGAETVTSIDQPQRELGLRVRRRPFEQVLRAAAAAERGVSLHVGHVEHVTSSRGRATGVQVGGRHVAADLVVDASGRAARLGRTLREPVQGADSGIAYVSRQYRLLPAADPGPMNAPIGLLVGYVGYQVIVFAHDNRTFSTLVVRAGGDAQLAALRHEHVFDAVTRLVPALATWTDPGRAEPITSVLPGGHLYNHYQGQLDPMGEVALPGLVFAGDAVCTTNPTLGRGVALCYLQAQRLLQLLDDRIDDLASTTAAFDQWCTENIKPWFDDHVQWDAEQGRRWSGHDIDLSRPLPSDLIMAATEVDPSMMKVVGPYMAMEALPSTLAAVEPRARAIYAGGWRPPKSDGPTRDELAEQIHRRSVHHGQRT